MTIRWTLIWGLALLSMRIHGESLSAGTQFEVRLSTATGSRISHAGDQVNGIITSSLAVEDGIVIPSGTLVFGNVDRVVKLGFGLKHTTASLTLRFDQLRLPGEQRLRSIDAHVLEVETARERVTSKGVVVGIHSFASLASASAAYAVPLLIMNPEFGAPVWIIKGVVAPSATPEIYFPPGTELILKLNRPLDISGIPRIPVGIAALSTAEVVASKKRLQLLPTLHSEAGKRASDPVNLLFFGSREQIDHAFQSAGWFAAERKSPISLYRMYNALTRRIGYRHAPMNALTLNGSHSDFVYQKSLNTATERHHVRFWRQSRTADVWAGAATEDIALKFRRMYWTHASDPAIDKERAKVVNDLAFTGCVNSAGLLKSPPKSVFAARRPIVSDGDVAVMNLNGCTNPKLMPGINGHMASRKSRFLPQLAMSFRDDIFRSNPVFTTYNSLKCLVQRQSRQTVITGSTESVAGPGLRWMNSGVQASMTPTAPPLDN